jgi:hypothetical protein
MLAISNFPDWMKGELYNNMNLICDGDGDYENPIIEKQLKTDLTIHNVTDILKIIDTCHYIGVELPFEVLDYVVENHTNLLEEIENMESNENPTPYDYFLTTPEFTAVRLCISFMKNRHIKTESTNNNIVCHNNKEFMKYAIIHNSLLLINYLYKKYENILYNDTCHDNIMRLLIITSQNGYVEIMKFWSQKEWFGSLISTIENQGELMMYAVSYNELPMLKYLHESLAFQPDIRTFEMALQQGHVDCIRYLIEKYFPIPRTILRKAILYRYPFESIRILVEEVGVIIDDRTCILLAVENGDLDMVKYLHEKKVPFHNDTVNFAFQNGLIQIAKYCIENGAPYDVNVFELYQDTLISKREYEEWITFLNREIELNM